MDNDRVPLWPFFAALIPFAIFILLGTVGQSFGRDSGQYQNSPHRAYFNSLRNKHNVSCCDNADGKRVEDPDWRRSSAGYQVRLNGQWITVPPEAVIESANPVGYAIVWPVTYDGRTDIRCFLPGVLS